MKKLQRKAKTEPGSDKEPKEERRTESPHSDHSKPFHLSPRATRHHATPFLFASLPFGELSEDWLMGLFGG